MNKYVKIGIALLLALAVFCLVYFIFIKKNDTDAVRFSKEYGIEEENVFVYRDSEEIIKILKNGTGIVYLGFPECQWCKAYVRYLNDVAKEEGVDKIYYYNILNDRKENNDTYKQMVKLLKGNLLFDEEGNERIYVPDVTFVLKGKIVSHDNESSVVEGDLTPEEYWTDSKVKALKERLKKGINLVNDDMCTSCNK